MRSLWRYPTIVCALLLLGAAVTPGSTVVATPARTFTAGPREPMLYPTSVAVDSTGRVWVADGARDRMLVFSADGSLSQTVRRVAGVALSRPSGVATSTDGRVWIADTGNSRVAVTSANSVKESSLPADKALGAVDLTDVAVSADGKHLWVVDNDGNRTFTVNPGTNAWEAHGKRGTAWGAFNHPRTVAVDAKGSTYVTDVLNGRVQHFDPAGRPMRPIVGYGVSPGQVFRPSGIDEEDGKVWVADSVVGVVQVFQSDGTLIDVVRDAQGNVLHLDGPIGLEVNGDHLYVVESKGSKVSEFTVAPGSGKPLLAVQVKTTTATASQGQECTLCHLDLIAPLDEGVATPLVGVPEKKGGQSWAGTEAACISCHDGSVLDSRTHIWSGVSHPRKDAVIPATMKIPQEMPLVDGTIACRTCHSPHTLGGSAQQHRSGMMLRVTLRPSELCVTCHSPRSDSEHPIGAVALDRAARIGNPKLTVIECMNCHQTHGAADSGLLAGRDHAASACLSCHKGLDLKTHAGSHPMDALVPRRAADALAKVGGWLGPNNTVVCGSCHTTHAKANIAARCFACHEEQAKVATTSATQEGHRSAICTDCHNEDSATLKAASARVEGDPSNCLRCHGTGSKNQPVDVHPGQVGHALVDRPGGFGPSDPPLRGCTSCHGGHEIVRPDSALCEGCHEDQAAAHARGGHGTATCIDCHPPHEDRAIHADAPDGHHINPVGRRCLVCHATDAPGDPSVPRVESFEHPAPMFLPDGPRWTPLGELPLFDAAGQKVAPTENGDLTCASCHLPHGPDQENEGDSLRRPGWEGPCSACHGDSALLYYRWFHFRERLKGVVPP